MKNFFGEFKKFITRGNVVDMAVGVLVGSSFTAIVNGLSNFVLKPIINWLLAMLFGANSLSELYTFLIEVKIMDDTTGEMVTDLTQSIYIDWGSFINAIINFFLVAFVLFCIVKVINKVREENKEFGEKIAKGKLTKAQRKELKANGVKWRDKTAVEAYFAEKKRLAEVAAAAEAAAEQAKVKAKQASKALRSKTGS